MPDISVILCTRNPRRDYLARVLDGLATQTLATNAWELLLIDNGTDVPLSGVVDLSWHPYARHVREDRVGLTPARLRGISEASADLLVFVDDDNVLESDYLERALRIQERYEFLGAFGAGAIEPEFEIVPPDELRPRQGLLAVRTIATPRWSNSPADYESIPWGAGLCVTRSIADGFAPLLERLQVTAVLGRKGNDLFDGEDELFSWVAALAGRGFGIFPELRINHLIRADRLTRGYFLRLIRDQAFSSSILHYRLARRQPSRLDAIQCLRLFLHGIRKGSFSMRCWLAASRGEDRAARYLAGHRLDPMDLTVPLEEAR